MKFKIPIGDWSDDGHGKCEWFVLESNTEMQKVMEAYQEMDKKYKISEQCSSYEEYEFTQEFVDLVRENGIDIDGTDEFNKYLEEKDSLSPTHEGLVNMIIDLIMLENPEIKLEVVTEEQMPTFYNWSWKGEGYLDLPGYGLFS